MTEDAKRSQLDTIHEYINPMSTEHLQDRLTHYSIRLMDSICDAEKDTTQSNMRKIKVNEIVFNAMDAEIKKRRGETVTHPALTISNR